MSNLIEIQWEGNNSKRFDGTINKVDRKHVTHGVIKKRESVVVQYKKGGKTWKGLVLSTDATDDSDSSDCDSDISLELPLVLKRSTEAAGITPTRKDAKSKRTEYGRVLKPRSLNKVIFFIFCRVCVCWI